MLSLIRIIAANSERAFEKYSSLEYISQIWPAPDRSQLKVIAQGKVACHFSSSLPKARGLISLSRNDSLHTPFLRSLELGNLTYIEEISPFVRFDFEQNFFECFAHPLGRGTFFYLSDSDTIFISTSLHDICFLQKSLDFDWSMIAEFFVSHSFFSWDGSKTFVRNVLQVPPAQKLIYAEGEVSIKPYWEPMQMNNLESADIAETTEAFKKAVDKEIMKRIDSDVVGCLVSGGLDSSFIASRVNRANSQLGGKTVLFTLGHNIDSSEEKMLQRKLSNHLGLQVVSPHSLKNRIQLSPLRRVNQFANAPTGGLFTGVFSEILDYASKQDILTVFGGEGGDEVFSTVPEILFDLFMKMDFVSLIKSLGHIASSSYDQNSFSLIGNSALLPFLATANNNRIKSLSAYIERKLWNLWDLDFLSVLLPNLKTEFSEVLKTKIEQFKLVVESGVSFSFHEHYKQVIDVPFYEPKHLPAQRGLSEVVVRSPLASFAVFRTAMQLRLPDRATLSLAFGHKALLQLASRDCLPPDIYLQPKTGVVNILKLMTQNRSDMLVDIIQAESVRTFNIKLERKRIDPTRFPPEYALYWNLLLVFLTWAKELQDGIHERQNLST